HPVHDGGGHVTGHVRQLHEGGVEELAAGVDLDQGVDVDLAALVHDRAGLLDEPAVAVRDNGDEGEPAVAGAVAGRVGRDGDPVAGVVEGAGEGRVAEGGGVVRVGQGGGRVVDTGGGIQPGLLRLPGPDRGLVFGRHQVGERVRRQ